MFAHFLFLSIIGNDFLKIVFLIPLVYKGIQFIGIIPYIIQFHTTE